MKGKLRIKGIGQKEKLRMHAVEPAAAASIQQQLLLLPSAGCCCCCSSESTPAAAAAACSSSCCSCIGRTCRSIYCGPCFCFCCCRLASPAAPVAAAVPYGSLIETPSLKDTRKRLCPGKGRPICCCSSRCCSCGCRCCCWALLWIKIIQQESRVIDVKTNVTATAAVVAAVAASAAHFGRRGSRAPPTSSPAGLRRQHWRILCLF